MDGFDARKGVIIMAATNRPEILDPALLRPGRFDRHVLVDRPNIKDREEILKIHIRGVKLSKDVDIAVIAARTPGFVGADLANIVNEAALLAARKDKTEVDMTDFEAAIDRIVAGLEKKTRVMNKKEKEIVAYHECGHTIVAELLPTTGPGAPRLDRPARHRGAGLHAPAPDRGPLPHDQDRAAGQALRHARRPRGRGDHLRRGLDRRAERPAAGGDHRAQHGHRVRDDREVRAPHLRKGAAAHVPRSSACRRAPRNTARRRRARSTRR